VTQWQHRAEKLDGTGYERVQFASEVSETHPHWCSTHSWAYATRCLACEDAEREAAPCLESA
jgi:hypothetical protein